VAAGADGVHLNIEPVSDSDPGFVELINLVRSGLPATATVSVAAVAPRNARIAVRPEYYWSFDYLRAVCRAADEVVVMGYDTWLDDPVTFRKVVAEWTAALIAELPAGDCSWRMGIPSYDDHAPHHKLDVERIDLALLGVRDGPAAAGRAGGFTGVAIYASWTTDAQEWAAYDALWLGRAPTAQVIAEPVR
jgi:hypothetical protein